MGRGVFQLTHERLLVRPEHWSRTLNHPHICTLHDIGSATVAKSLSSRRYASAFSTASW